MTRGTADGVGALAGPAGPFPAVTGASRRPRESGTRSRRAPEQSPRAERRW